MADYTAATAALTSDHIRALLDEAYGVDDELAASMCRLALAGSRVDRRRCVAMIVGAHAHELDCTHPVVLAARGITKDAAIEPPKETLEDDLAYAAEDVHRGRF